MLMWTDGSTESQRVDPVQYAQLVLDHVQADRLAAEGHCQFDYQHSGQVWHVQVDQGDYAAARAAVAPAGGAMAAAAPMDVDWQAAQQPAGHGAAAAGQPASAWAYRDTAPSDDEQDPHPVNPHGLTDNCYYATAAELSGTDTDHLVAQTEVMQQAGGAALEDITNLFAQAGLGANPVELANLDEVEARVFNEAGGLDTRFGLGFRRADNSRHVVVVAFDAVAQTCQYRDFQPDRFGDFHAEGVDAQYDVATGQQFWLFVPGVHRQS